MPRLHEAIRFAEDPESSLHQLRLACEILTLDTSGTADEVRARLLAHLHSLEPAAPIVCLKPNVSH